MTCDMPPFLDFEASSLGRDSYPVEVAFSDGSGAIQSYLIARAHGWIDWDDVSESIHGISRDKLDQGGIQPFAVLDRMNVALDGQTVYCDDAEYDGMWLDRLVKAAGSPVRFDLRDIREIIGNWEPLEDEARRIAGTAAHRAGGDVTYLQSLYRLVMDD